MNLEGLRIAVFINHYKKQDNHPDYNVVISDEDQPIAEGGLYIATDKHTGERRTDKNGNKFMTGKLRNPRDRNQSTGTSGPASTPDDDDLPF